MNEMMKHILASKRDMRKKLAKLPIEQKLDLVRMMRDRSSLIASNPLRQPIMSVSGEGVKLSGLGARTRGSKPGED